MKKPFSAGKTVLFLLLICSLSLPLAGATEINEYALFKRTISPVWLWGDTGLLTVPKAMPIGLYNLYISFRKTIPVSNPNL